MLGSSVFLSLALVAFSFSKSWYLSLGLVALIGFGQAAGFSLTNSLIQYYVDDQYRGRVMSILQMQIGMMALGTFVAGMLTEAIGIQWALGSFGAIMVAVTIAAYIYFPRIRELD